MSTPTTCDRCGKRVRDRDDLDLEFICEQCRVQEHIEGGIGPGADDIARTAEALASNHRPGAVLARSVLLWVAGHAHWNRDVLAKINETSNAPTAGRLSDRVT